MSTFRLLVLLLTLGFSLSVAAQQPRLLLISAKKVADIKRNVSSDSRLKANVAQLARAADKALAESFGSVMDKQFTPPCGNRHEYMSMAKYFWPDSTKPGGVPYIRKDGQKNPEVDQISDDKNFDKMNGAVRNLAWAYYFTNKEKYAAKAIALLRMWFIDTATAMAPNLNHGQMTKGIDTGRGSGIIDTHNIPWILDAVTLLSASSQWNKTDDSAIKAWFDSYLYWLLNSRIGRHEGKTKNNHKTFYETQVAAIALFRGKDSIAQRVFEQAKHLMAAQIEPDGREPEELVRTLSLQYSTFNLQAWFMLANVAENAGVDLWSYTTADGRSLRKAIDYLMPYALGEKEWTYQQIAPYKQADFYSLLLQAAEKFNDDRYRKEAEKIATSNKNSLVRIFYE